MTHRFSAQWHVVAVVALACAASTLAAAQFQERTAPVALPGEPGRDPRIAGDTMGNWVVVFTSDFDFPPVREAAMFSRSSDNGVTWSDPAPLDPSTPPPPYSAAKPEIVTDGAGTWIAVWSKDHGIAQLRQTWSVRSTDNGATWSTPVMLGSSNAIFLSDYHSIATDKAGNWIIMWSGDSAGLSNVAYVRSSDNGLTWSAEATIPSAFTTEAYVATNGTGRWIAVWAHTSGIFHSSSTDNGSSWSTPFSISNVFGSAVSVVYGGGNSWVIFWEVNPGPGLPSEIYTSRSDNNGVTWASPLEITYPVLVPAQRLYPHVTTDEAGNWIAAWRHNILTRSSDAFASWTDPSQLEFDTDHFSTPAVATDGAGDWIMFWREMNAPGSTKGEILYSRWTGILAPDRDGDNLSDADETNAGSSSDSWDTDNDGLSDEEEVNTYGTNPVLADTDGDGVWDFIEISLGTDPNDEFDFPVLPLSWAGWIAVALAGFGVAALAVRRRARPQR